MSGQKAAIKLADQDDIDDMIFSGFGDTSMPASIRNISQVFKPSPFQQPVTIESFIMEKPDIFYTTTKIDEIDALSTPPSSRRGSRETEFVSANDNKLFTDNEKQKSSEPSTVSNSEVPSAVTSPKPDNLLDLVSNINDSGSAVNVENAAPTEITNNNMLFDNLTATPHPLSFTNLSDLNFSFDLKNSRPDSGDNLNIQATGQSFTVSLTDDKQLTISSPLDLKEFDLSTIDDFETDLAALQSTNFEYSSLIQLPLRDSGYSNTPSSTEESPANYDSPELNPYSDNHYDTIPRSLEPLPDLLLAVPTYRDLFHHYVYVTADILVPAPIIYPQNPFKTILPAMALQTPHLLALLLAFSAHHRARFLRMEIPKQVISRLLARVFQGFIRCLENETEAKSDTTLTTAILLTSFEILTSGGRNSWKTHMHGARDIVIARDFAQSLMEKSYFSFDFTKSSSSGTNSSTPQHSFPSTSPKLSLNETISSNVIGPKPLGVLRSDIDETNVSFFLVRWFAYLDVIGSLSSFKASAFLTTSEDMAQLWGLHDWHIARIKQRSLEEIQHSRSLPPTQPQTPEAIQSDGEILDVSARHYGIKVDFLLGIDLDVLPLFSKISSLVRQRQRLTESLKMFLSNNPNATEENSEYIRVWKNDDQSLKSEALELSDILLSLCEAYELRRKQYITNAIGIMERKRRDSNSSSPSSNSSSPTNNKDSPITNNNYPTNADAFDYTSIFGNTVPKQVETSVSATVQNNSLLNNPNEFVFSAESLEKLNIALKKTEDVMPAVSQLPASVQAHSQLSIMNTTFCYAAILHLYRRVMNLPSYSPMVQNIVKHNTKLLTRHIPLGSPVEACMSFPVFTIACEVLEHDQETRKKYWLRLKGMDRFGVEQTSVARKMVERCWKEKRDWPDVMQEIGWDIALT